MAESSTGSATVPHGDPSSPASQSQSQFQEIHSGNGNGNRNGDEDIDSLPSTETDDSEDQLDESDAEREWRESLQQLELILTMVLVPYIGKYFGRKAAYWGWAKFMTWKYPVEVVVTSPMAFKAAGAAEAAAAL